MDLKLETFTFAVVGNVKCSVVGGHRQPWSTAGVGEPSMGTRVPLHACEYVPCPYPLPTHPAFREEGCTRVSSVSPLNSR